MNSSRRVTAAAVGLSMALGGGIAVAQADAGTTIYVDSASTNCTDSGTGTAAAPYCTIQAAANAAVTGDTVDIEAGNYVGPLTISAQGEPDEPIVFQAVGGRVGLAPGTATYPLTFDGASYVTFNGLEGATGPDFFLSNTLVENSSYVTVEGLLDSRIEVAGTSDNVAVSRNNGENRGSIEIESGSADDVVSGNYLIGSAAGISATDAPATEITSNTVRDTGNAAYPPIGVSGTSPGTTVENNVIDESAQGTVAEIAVDSAAAAGTTEDYNVVWPYTLPAGEAAAYSWAGKDYSTQSAFSAATGQGEHDLVADPYLSAGPYWIDPHAPQINSANGAAPGMPSYDLYGNSCSDDPAVAITGAGTPAYCARGAGQPAYTDSMVAAASPVTALGVDLDSSLSQTVYFQGGKTSIPGSPTPAVTYTVNWGDGQSQTVQGSSSAAATSTSHTYAKIGTYSITDTANLTNGGTESTTTSFTTGGSGYTPLGPVRILNTRTGLGGHPGALSNTIIVPVAADGKIELYNAELSGSVDLLADVSGYFSAAAPDAYVPVTPYRVVDTRTPGNGPINDDSTYPFSMDETDVLNTTPYPVGATFAANLTATEETANGALTVYPLGSTVPNVSALNYGAGQNTADFGLFATSGQYDMLNVYNNSAGSTDILIDLFGYFANS